MLHLSDIHFSVERNAERILHTDVRDQLLHDVTQFAPLDAVLVAGDIAYSGKREEYQMAAEWLESVTSRCRCPVTSVLTVPGNHDVDLARVLIATKMFHRRLRHSSLPEAIAELVELAESNDGALTDKLIDYQAFAASYGCEFRSSSRPDWSRPLPLDSECTLKFVGLTTVQVSDREDQKGALFLGRHQYVFDRDSSVEHVVVMHHPFEWLKDRQEAEQYLSTRARVIIFGHEHVQQIHKIQDLSGDERLIVGSGALTPEHAAEPYIYRYNVLEFNVRDQDGERRLSVTIHPRVWVPEATRFEADTARLSGRQFATFDLRCPQFNCSAPAGDEPTPNGPNPGDPQMESSEESFARLRYLFWRYLDWSQRVTVLVRAGILPSTISTPVPQAVEHVALQNAKESDRLRTVWDLVMEYVPASKREPNPYAS